MRGQIIYGIVILGLVGFGCDQPTETAQPTVEDVDTGTVRDATRSVEERTAAATDAGQEMARDAGATADSAREGAAQATAEQQAEAQKLLDQALEYIKENKYDLAEQTLTQLENMKASLPTSMQSSIEQARTMLNTAKASGNLPGGLAPR